MEGAQVSVTIWISYMAHSGKMKDVLDAKDIPEKSRKGHNLLWS